MNKAIIFLLVIGCAIAGVQAQTQEEVIIDNDCGMLVDNLTRCQPYGCLAYDNELQDVRATYVIIGKNQDEKKPAAFRCRLAAWYGLKDIIVHTDGVYDEVEIKAITERLQIPKDRREISGEKLHEEITRREEAVANKANGSQKIPGEAPDTSALITKVENTDMHNAITQQLSAAISDHNPYWNEDTISSLAKQSREENAEHNLADFLDNLEDCMPYRFVHKDTDPDATHIIHGKKGDRCHYDYVTRDFLVGCTLSGQEVNAIKNFFKQNFVQENEYLEPGINNESPDRSISEKTPIQIASKDNLKSMLLDISSCALGSLQHTNLTVEPYVSSIVPLKGPIITSQATIEKIKQALSNFVKHKGQKQAGLGLNKEKEEIQHKGFVLGAVVYLSEDAWTFWINNQKITNRDSRKLNDKLQITDVTYNSVSFSMPYHGMPRDPERLQPNKRPTQDNVVIDSDVVRFTLYTNQEFSLDTMSISDVQPAKEEYAEAGTVTEDVKRNIEGDIAQDSRNKKAVENSKDLSETIDGVLPEETGSVLGGIENLGKIIKMLGGEYDN